MTNKYEDIHPVQIVEDLANAQAVADQVEADYLTTAVDSITASPEN